MSIKNCTQSVAFLMYMIVPLNILKIPVDQTVGTFTK